MYAAARSRSPPMVTDLARYGVCGVVQCSKCPRKISNLCPGCRARDVDVRNNGGERCGIFVCAEQHRLESCFYCKDFPCEVFLSPESLYLPVLADECGLTACNIASISHNPAEVSGGLVRRLIRYLMVVEHGLDNGREITKSSEFASALGIKPELVRKDMAGLGYLGIPHVGYDLHKCREALRHTLNLHSVQNIVWIGLEQLNSSRQMIKWLSSFGCRVVAILDCNGNNRQERESIGNIRIFKFGVIEKIVKNLAVTGGIVACENNRVQRVADRLMELGIRSILNLTSVPLDHPEDVFIRNIDISEDLTLFSFYCRTE